MLVGGASVAANWLNIGHLYEWYELIYPGKLDEWFNPKPSLEEEAEKVME